LASSTELGVRIIWAIMTTGEQRYRNLSAKPRSAGWRH
jgi:hypothetical protein